MTLSTSAVAVCCWRQLVKQPRVLYSDDGLRGEVSYQLDLFLREWLRYDFRHEDRPYHACLTQQGYAKC